jgi:hypothetical protein
LEVSFPLRFGLNDLEYPAPWFQARGSFSDPFFLFRGFFPFRGFFLPVVFFMPLVFPMSKEHPDERRGIPWAKIRSQSHAGLRCGSKAKKKP